MRRWILVCVIACGKQSTPVASGSGSGSAAPIASDAAAPPPAADKITIDPSPDPALKVAFDGRVPQLPAISPDGSKLAQFASDADGPQPVQPWSLVIDSITNAEKPVSLELIDDSIAAAQQATWEDSPPSADIVAKLRKNAAAITKKLHDGGYASLVDVEVGLDSSGKPETAKIGELTITVKKPSEVLEIHLRDRAGKTLHREKFPDYDQGEADFGTGEKGSCHYRPNIVWTARDAENRHLYFVIRVWHNEMCDHLPDRYIVWDLPPPDPEVEAITKLVHAQFDAQPRDAVLVSTTGIVKTFDGSADYARDDVAVTIARDGKSAWASAITNTWRASDLAVKTATGWQLAALAWTMPMANDEVNRDAKAGKLVSPKFAGDAGDASLNAAFAKLATSGLDAGAAARGDLVAIGSGPGERTVGPVFGKAWNAAWKGHVTIASSIARAAPSGTTGWVAARIELAKQGYKIPFFAFAVFDKSASGEWSLVHIHFAA
jgi:hypothetical protein